MKHPAFATIMNIWVDEHNASVVDALDAPSVREGMKLFKRDYLYDYAIRKIGHLPYRHEHYEMLKDYWRKERKHQPDLQ